MLDSQDTTDTVTVVNFIAYESLDTHLEQGGCRMKEDLFDNYMPPATLCLPARRFYTFCHHPVLGGWYIGQFHMPKCIPDPLSLHEDRGSETNK